MSTRPDEKTCSARCSDGSECNAWAVDGKDKCYHHMGTSKDGSSHKGNQHNQRHGLYSTPEYLKQHFSEDQEDRYIAYFEALCSRYERRLGKEPDAFAKDRLSRVAIECVKERIADEWLAEQAEETGNLLVEQFYNDEGIPQKRENQILRELTALKRETRMTLKDMGLLHDPETEQAQATKELGAVVAEALEPQD